MAKIKEIKRRIKSVKATKKITRAMELVAAVKMKKAQDKALGTRPYAAQAWEILVEAIEKIENKDHFLLRPRATGEGIIVVVSSDRGLCGGLNGNLFRFLEKFLDANSKKKFAFITIGKTAADYARRTGREVVAAFSRLDNLPHVVEVRPAVRILFDELRAEKRDTVFVAFNRFLSSTSQMPAIKQLLPIEKSELLSARELFVSAQKQKAVSARRFSFEPSAEEVLEAVVPQLMEMQLYQTVLESNASEHSARMIAMHNATKNSEELLGDLVSHYNQSRQQSITQEIAEISSAAEAMA
ncbi:ATP synthase F1 subunit gamma [Candidatus Azambacteria bacterium]|nr:ATP synthase F1 subunit gamma [Candidatus Azambacteria bacterium]